MTPASPSLDCTLSPSRKVCRRATANQAPDKQSLSLTSGAYVAKCAGLLWPRMKHGLTTDADSSLFRVSSVFHPWLAFHCSLVRGAYMSIHTTPPYSQPGGANHHQLLGFREQVGQGDTSASRRRQLIRGVRRPST